MDSTSLTATGEQIMTLGRDMTKMVQAKLAQMGAVQAVHFCQLAKREGVEFVNITYPTGLRMVKASAGTESAEVPLERAKTLRADGYTIRS